MDNSPEPVSSTEQAAIDTSLLLLNRVVHAAVTSIVVTDPRLPDNPIVFHNPAFEAISGYASSEIDGRNCRFLQGPDTDPAAVQTIRDAIAREEFCHVTLLNYRKDGTPFSNELALSPVHDADGRLTHFVGVQNDVTRRTDAERERDVLIAQQKSIVDTLHKALLLTSPPAYESLEVATQFQPAHAEALIGGDFFDVFSLDEQNVALVCGDVTGKGLKAARYTAEVKYGLRILLREHPQRLAQAMGRMNGFLQDSLRLDDRDQDTLVCVSVAIVNTQTGEVEVSLSGMEAPLIIRPDGSHQALEAFGPILGMSADAEYRVAHTTLGIGDVLLLTTDGITEVRNGKMGAFFGEGALLALAKNIVSGKNDEADESDETGGEEEKPTEPRSLEQLEHMSAEIVRVAKAFASGLLSDDICLLLARRSVDSSSLERTEAQAQTKNDAERDKTGMSLNDNPFAVQDAAFLRGLVVPRDDRNDIVVQKYRGCVGIHCLQSHLLFAHLVDQIGNGIGKVGVSRLLRTAKVVPVPGEAGVMVFWRDLPWSQDR